MFRDENILFPTDFSPYAQYAMTYAVAMAKKYGVGLHVAHVLDSALFSHGGGHGLWLTQSDADGLHDSMREHAGARLEHLVHQAEQEEVSAQAHIVTGRPADETVRLAAELNCGLVVIPTHGLSGLDRLVHGSVCERVMRQSPCPVLAIKHPEHEFISESGLKIQLKRVLFPCDFSDFSKKGLPYAVSLCKEFGATLVLVNVVETVLVGPEIMSETVTMVNSAQLEHAEEHLDKLREEAGDVDVMCRNVEGQPFRMICRLVEEDDVDLVVMPTHGRAGISHFFFGSVAEKVVRMAKCPVLTIRPNGPPLPKP